MFWSHYSEAPVQLFGDPAVEVLHEHVYWRCFCGFNTFQGGQILDSISMVKFRNRIGVEGMIRTFI